MSADTPLVGNPIRQQFYQMMELHRDLSYETVRVGLSSAEDQPFVYNYELLARLSFMQVTLSFFFESGDFKRVYPCDKVEVWENVTEEMMTARTDFQAVLKNLRQRLMIIWSVCDENNWWDKSWGYSVFPTDQLKEGKARPKTTAYPATLPP